MSDADLTISDHVVWTTIQEAVPSLVPSLRKVLNAAATEYRE